MNQERLNELLKQLNVQDKIDKSQPEHSILHLLEIKLNEYIDRDDEHMQEIIDEAIAYQKKVIDELESSVVVSDPVKAPKKEAAKKTDYRAKLDGIKNKSADKGNAPKPVAAAAAATATATSNGQASVQKPVTPEELWFTSNSGSSEVDDLFDKLQEALEQKDVVEAKRIADTLLDKEPTNAGIYLAIYLANNRISKLATFFAREDISFNSDNNLKRVQQYANAQQKKYIDDLLFERRAKKEYAQALSLKMSLTTSDECKKAAELFEGLNDYKDSKKYAAECRKKEKELLEDEKEAKEKLDKRSKQEADKAEVERLRGRLTSRSITMDDLEDAIKDLEQLRKEHPEFAGTLDVDIKDGKERLKDMKKAARSNGKPVTSRPRTNVGKAFHGFKMLYTGAIYVIVYVALFYVATSLRLVTDAWLNSPGNFPEYPKVLHSIYSPMPAPMFVDNYVIADGMSDTVVSLHSLYNIYLDNSKATQYYVPKMQDTYVEVTNAPYQEAVYENVCEKFYFYNSPKTQTLTVDNVERDVSITNNLNLEKVTLGECSGTIYVELCNNLKEISIAQGAQKVEIKECYQLEKITLPDSVTQISLTTNSGQMPLIESTNPNLVVTLELVSSQDKLVLKGASNGTLVFVGDRSSDDTVVVSDSIHVEGYAKVIISDLSKAKSVTLGKGVALASINYSMIDAAQIHVLPELQQLEIVNVDSGEDIKVPELVYEEGTYDLFLYLAAFSDKKLTLDEQITRISVDSFPNLTRINLPETVKFAQVLGCPEFSKLDFPDGVKKSKIPHYVETTE